MSVCTPKSFDLTGKVALITGASYGIGFAIATAMANCGATIVFNDIKQELVDKGLAAYKEAGIEAHGYVCDVTNEDAVNDMVKKITAEVGHINVLVNNALPLTRGLDTCTYEEFNAALRVGVTAPFYLTKLFSPCFAPGASIINISSSRDRMSQPQTESYTAAKGGIAALTHALAESLAGRVRVNSISPGWIDTAFTRYEGPDASQHPAGRVGHPLDIANMVLYLASDKAGFITGENICIDGGMTRQMIYHNDFGWTLEDKQ